MSDPVKKAVLRDVKRLRDEPLAGIRACPEMNNLLLWKAVILGPEGTLWDGGVFKLRIELPNGKDGHYPEQPPKITFVTPIFHPNVYKDGKICLDILQVGKWTSKMTIESALLSIQSLLNDPNPDSPANKEAAKLFKTDKAEYEKKVRECVESSISQDE